jgi:MoxR-like ATPase
MQNRDAEYEKAAEIIKSIINETAKGYIGMPKVLEMAVLALVSGLHLLIEDLTGVGKTTLIRCLATVSGLDLGRIQFTPDLLPGDITGMMIWEPVQKAFLYREGPIHHRFIMADELNRAPARTQSALLEAMQEKSVTIDGVSRTLPRPFFVAATQNPSWYAGTYNLPESQLDRFGFSLSPGYPDSDTEVTILGEFKDHQPVDMVKAVTNSEEILNIQSLIAQVFVAKPVLDYTVAIGRKTRNFEKIQTGLSIRAQQHLLKAGQSVSILNGRSFLIPEDLLQIAVPVLRHRLLLTPDSRSKGEKVENVIQQILSEIPKPSL